MARVLDWNGKDVPEGLRTLPPGQYVVEAIDTAPTLTQQEEEGIREAIRSLDEGQGRSLAEVRESVAAFLKP